MHERAHKCTVYTVKSIKRSLKFFLLNKEEYIFNNYLCRAAFMREMRPIDNN